MQVLLARARHLAVRVRHDEHAVHAEQVRREHQGSQHVVGHAGAGVAQDLDVALLHAEQLQRLDPAVHAGDERESLERAAGEPGAGEGRGVRRVAGEDVGERVASGRRTTDDEPSERRWPSGRTGVSATAGAARAARRATRPAGSRPPCRSSRVAARAACSRCSGDAPRAPVDVAHLEPRATSSSLAPAQAARGPPGRRRGAARRASSSARRSASSRTDVLGDLRRLGAARCGRGGGRARRGAARARRRAPRAPTAGSRRPKACPLGSSSAVGAKRWPPRWLTSRTSPAYAGSAASDSATGRPTVAQQTSRRALVQTSSTGAVLRAPHGGSSPRAAAVSTSARSGRSRSASSRVPVRMRTPPGEVCANQKRRSRTSPWSSAWRPTWRASSTVVPRGLRQRSERVADGRRQVRLGEGGEAVGPGLLERRARRAPGARTRRGARRPRRRAPSSGPPPRARSRGGLGIVGRLRPGRRSRATCRDRAADGGDRLGGRAGPTRRAGGRWAAAAPGRPAGSPRAPARGRPRRRAARPRP